MVAARLECGLGGGSAPPPAGCRATCNPTFPQTASSLRLRPGVGNGRRCFERCFRRRHGRTAGESQRTSTAPHPGAHESTCRLIIRVSRCLNMAPGRSLRQRSDFVRLQSYFPRPGRAVGMRAPDPHRTPSPRWLQRKADIRKRTSLATSHIISTVFGLGRIPRRGQASVTGATVPRPHRG